MSYGQGHKRERSPGRWQFVVAYEGQTFSKSWPGRGEPPEPSARKANSALARYVSEVHGGDVVASSERTVADVVADYIASRRDRLGIRTLEEYDGLLRSRIKPSSIGTLRADKLTVAKVDQFYREMTARGLSPASVRRTHALLHVAFDRAEKYRWVGRNPTELADLPPARPKEFVPPTPEQAQLILANVTDDEAHAAIALAAATGLRRGEVCGVRVRNLDLDNGVVKVRDVVITPKDGLQVVPNPKTEKSRREVPLVPQVAELLRAHLAERPDRKRDSFVFSHVRDGSIPLHPSAMSTSFMQARNAVGVECRLHDLRHAFATELIRAGVDVATVSALLGHAQTSTTLNIYSHSVEASKRDAIDTLARLRAPRESV